MKATKSLSIQKETGMYLVPFIINGVKWFSIWGYEEDDDQTKFVLTASKKIALFAKIEDLDLLLNSKKRINAFNLNKLNDMVEQILKCSEVECELEISLDIVQQYWNHSPVVVNRDALMETLHLVHNISDYVSQTVGSFTYTARYAALHKKMYYNFSAIRLSDLHLAKNEVLNYIKFFFKSVDFIGGKGISV